MFQFRSKYNIISQLLIFRIVLMLLSQKKPYFLHLDSKANLHQYPQLLNFEIAGKRWILGDMHGNADDLLHSLIKLGIILLSKENYFKFGQLYYKKPEDYTDEDIQAVNEIYAACKFNAPKETILTLAGDLVRDRGMNDWLTLGFIKVLRQNLDLRINHSNHDAEFIKVFQAAKEGELVANDNLGEEWTKHFGASMQGLVTLFEKKLVSREEVEDIMVNYYYPSLRLVDYARVTDEEGKPAILICSHAIADLNVIGHFLKKDLPKLFPTRPASEFRFAPQTLEGLIDAIKRLNNFGNELVMTNRFAELKAIPAYNFLVNNRNQQIVKRRQSLVEAQFKITYKIYSTNGHDDKPCPDPNVIIVDNNFGKSRGYPYGEFRALEIDNVASPTKENTLEEAPADSKRTHKSQKNKVAKAPTPKKTAATKRPVKKSEELSLEDVLGFDEDLDEEQENSRQRQEKKVVQPLAPRTRGKEKSIEPNSTELKAAATKKPVKAKVPSPKATKNEADPTDTIESAPKPNRVARRKNKATETAVKEAPKRVAKRKNAAPKSKENISPKAAAKSGQPSNAKALEKNGFFKTKTKEKTDISPSIEHKI